MTMPAPVSKYKNFPALIAVGLAIGALGFFSPGSLFFAVISLGISVLLYYGAAEEERGFLVRLFMAGLALRLILLLAVNFIYAFFQKWVYYPDESRAIAFFGDSALCTVRGLWLKQYFFGGFLHQTEYNAAFNPYGYSTYLYLVSLFYYLFGYSPVSVTFMNCIISVLTGLVFYSIARDLLGRRSARVVAAIIVFFPSLILWSILNLKDSLFIFLTALILWAFVRLLRRAEWRYFVVITMAVSFQASLRSFILIPTAFTLFLSLALIKMKRRHILWLLVLSLGLIILFKIDFKKYICDLIVYQRGVISTGGFTYKMFDDWVYVSGAPLRQISNLDIVKGLARGWFHFILEPFPWKICSNLSAFSMFQMPAWYLLLPFSLVGMLAQLKENYHKTLIFLLYLFVIGNIFVLTGGNVGTSFRLRDLFTPIFILFAVAGFRRIFYPAEGIGSADGKER